MQSCDPQLSYVHGKLYVRVTKQHFAIQQFYELTLALPCHFRVLSYQPGIHSWPFVSESGARWNAVLCMRVFNIELALFKGLFPLNHL